MQIIHTYEFACIYVVLYIICMFLFIRKKIVILLCLKLDSLFSTPCLSASHFLAFFSSPCLCKMGDKRIIMKLRGSKIIIPSMVNSVRLQSPIFFPKLALLGLLVINQPTSTSTPDLRANKQEAQCLNSGLLDKNSLVFTTTFRLI